MERDGYSYLRIYIKVLHQDLHQALIIKVLQSGCVLRLQHHAANVMSLFLTSKFLAQKMRFASKFLLFGNDFGSNLGKRNDGREG